MAIFFPWSHKELIFPHMQAPVALPPFTRYGSGILYQTWGDDIVNALPAQSNVLSLAALTLIELIAEILGATDHSYEASGIEGSVQDTVLPYLNEEIAGTSTTYWYHKRVRELQEQWFNHSLAFEVPVDSDEDLEPPYEVHVPESDVGAQRLMFAASMCLNAIAPHWMQGSSPETRARELGIALRDFGEGITADFGEAVALDAINIWWNRTWSRLAGLGK